MISSSQQQSSSISSDASFGEHILAFDFSSSRGSLCLWRGTSLRASRRALSFELSAKAEILPGLIDTMLRGCSVSYDDLRAICFVRGPGSYTGLRASLAVARGLRLAHRRPPPALAMYSLTSFEAALLTMRARNMERGESDARGVLALALVESFHDSWYAQAFHANQPLGKPLSKPQSLDDEELAGMVAGLLARGEKLFLCGAAAGRAAKMLEDSDLRRKSETKLNNWLVRDGESRAEDFSRELVAWRAEQGFSKRANSKRASSKRAKSQRGLIKYASGAKALLPLYIGCGV